MQLKKIFFTINNSRADGYKKVLDFLHENNITWARTDQSEVEYIYDGYYYTINNNLELELFPLTSAVRDLLVEAGYTYVERETLVGNNLPKTWEEFCKNFPNCNEDYYIDNTSCISKFGNTEEGRRNPIDDRNLYPSKELAEAGLALMQLLQLVKVYNGDWEPNWLDNTEHKWVIYFYKECIRINAIQGTHFPLAFKNEDIAKKFLNNFEKLIKKALPLL